MVDDPNAADQLDALAATTPDVLVTIDHDSRIQFVNPAVEEVLGYSPDELEGEPLTTIMPPEFADRHREGIARYLSTGEPTLDWEGIELPAEHRDGHRVPLSISFSEFTRDGRQYFTGVMRDVSERRRWTEKLERLVELGQDLLEVETVPDVCDGAVAAATELLDLPLIEVALYDAEEARLATRAQSEAARTRCEGASLFRSARGPSWQAFVADEPLTFTDGATAADVAADDTPLGRAILVPMGSHGVLVAGDATAGAISGTDRRLVRVLATTVAGVLDRIDRERTLRERTGELEARTDEYERVRRLNDVIRDITQALLSATSREEIKQVVCDRLADAPHYRFVWFGEHDVTTDDVVPVAWAGAEQGYLDAVEITAEEGPTGEGPAGRALRSQQPQIQNDVQSDPPFEPWRQEAIKRGYRSGISVPVAFGETVYGVLNLYASEAGVFEEMEVRVLQELGEMVGYSLNAMERYDALVAEESVELEFVIHDAGSALVELLSDHQGTFHLESIGERRGDVQRVFLTFERIPRSAIRSFARRLGVEETVTVVRETEEEVVVRLGLPGDSAIATLLDHGAVPTELRGTAEEARLTVRIAREASVRDLVERLERRYEDVELLARRESTEPVRTVEEFRQALQDRLTERQEEVLRTAYFAGFFDQPRTSSARDVAEMLDVSQPTVSRHVRAGEKALFSLLFDDG